MILRIVVFGAGAVLMALEIVGSRVLAPSFGSSVYVWGSLISIFLAALSLGYYAGGRAADRWPRTGVLASALSLAGLGILLLPQAASPILERFVQWDLGPRLSPLLASVALFALPSVLLGTTSPFAVKLAATDLATVGNTAGLLYAISTAGSIAGTLVTAFVLIPVLGVRAILYILGGTLVVLAVLLAAAAPKSATRAVSMVLILVVLGVPGLADGASLRLIYEKDSLYHRIRIYDDATYRYLRFDRSIQGGMVLRDPLTSVLRYPDYIHLAWLLNPAISRVLVVGLGAGSIPKRLLRDYPAVTVDSVELDPAVVDIAKQYFSVQEDRRHRITVADGRQFLRRTDASYDLIVMDAYFAEGIPFHLVTREFLRLVKSHLRPGGMVAANIVGAVGGSNSKLFRAIYKTYASEFPALYPFPVAYQHGHEDETTRTIILFATDKVGQTKQTMTASLSKLRRDHAISPVVVLSFLGDYYSVPIPITDVPLLTDDYAPVDILPVYGWEPERR